MLLKRNVMAVALISAGLFITVAAYAATADTSAAPASASATPTSPAATPQNDTTDTKASAAK